MIASSPGSWPATSCRTPPANRSSPQPSCAAARRSNEGGITDEEYRVEYVNERAELVGKAFLGLTVGCAKCHDHKYDVIRQADYYSMGGFFNSVDERGIASAPAARRRWARPLAWPTAAGASAWPPLASSSAAREQALNAALRRRAQDARAQRRGRSAARPRRPPRCRPRWTAGSTPICRSRPGLQGASTDPLLGKHETPPVACTTPAGADRGHAPSRAARCRGSPAGHGEALRAAGRSACPGQGRRPPAPALPADPDRIHTVNDDSPPPSPRPRPRR